jgi:hypothetical protein
VRGHDYTLTGMTGAELWTCEEEALRAGDGEAASLARAEIDRRAAALEALGGALETAAGRYAHAAEDSSGATA